jgi:drug/metabolite transporter (DMT)-like permease
MFTFSYTTLAILSAVFAAIANILARTLLKDVKSRDILGINFAIMAITLLVLLPFFYHFTVTSSALGLVGLIGFVDTVANYFYFKAFEQTEASVATPILSLAPGFTFLFGWLFLDDVVSTRIFALTVAIILLIIIFSADFKQFKRFRANTLSPALAASFLFGISAIPSKELLSQLHAINAPTLYLFRASLIAMFAFVFFRNPMLKLTTKQYQLTFIRGLFVITQWLLLYYALSKGNAGVTVTLGNITPIFVFVFSVIFLRERATFRKIIAAVLILALSLLI